MMFSDRLERITDCLLRCNEDNSANIHRLTALCGELLGADCALYNRLEGDILCSLGQWQTPQDFKASDAPAGHICYDVIKGNSNEVVLISDLPSTHYVRTDPNVRAYSLKTYLGHAIISEGKAVGSLCLVYKTDFIPTDDDKKILELIASAVGHEDTRWKSKEALRESRQMLQAVLDTIPVRVFWKDRDLTFLGCNRSFASDAGLSSPADIIGRNDFEMGWKEQAEAYRTDDRWVMETGEPKVGYEEPQTAPDGGCSWLCTSKIPLRDQQGGICGVLGTYEDITERKKMEAALRRSHEELELQVMKRTAELSVTNEKLLAEIEERKRAESELSKSLKQIQQLAANLQRVREEERTDIAREIHDELGQALTALKIDLSLMTSKFAADSDSNNIGKQLTADLDIIDSTILAVRRICTRLRPTILDHLGLEAAVDWQIKEFRKRTACRCLLTFDLENIVLENHVSTAIFRILQESLTNVMRHAEASLINVVLSKKDESVVLAVHDNGKGYNESSSTKPKSFGLVGIQERVRSLGGSFEMRGSRGAGTTVTVNIPIESSLPSGIPQIIGP